MMGAFARGDSAGWSEADQDDEHMEEDVPFALCSTEDFSSAASSMESAAARGGLEAWIKMREAGSEDEESREQDTRVHQQQATLAAAMFVLGWCCFFPWLIGAKFIKSRNMVARVYGIASLVFAVAVTIFVSGFLLHARIQHLNNGGT